MIEDIKIGLKNKAQKTVTEHNTAAAFGTGALEVFSTPTMAAMMEEAAFLLLKNAPISLDSVGIALNINHSRACLVGEKVWADAEITAIDRKAITFKVTAFDSQGEIGSGSHTRFIIDSEKFMQKLQKNKN